jgi:hypothetical protein
MTMDPAGWRTHHQVHGIRQSSPFELERTRQLSELTRRLNSAIQIQRTSYEENSAEIIAAKKRK